MGSLFLTDRLHDSGGDEYLFNSEIRVYGLRMGRIYGLRRCDAALLFCRSEEIPDSVRFKVDRVLCAVAAVLYVAAECVPIENICLRMTFRTLLLCLFIAYIIKRDLPLSQIPVINRFIRK